MKPCTGTGATRFVYILTLESPDTMQYVPGTTRVPVDVRGPVPG
jgi:hypothetical protein